MVQESSSRMDGIDVKQPEIATSAPVNSAAGISSTPLDMFAGADTAPRTYLDHTVVPALLEGMKLLVSQR
jgi:hypothetical protein